MQVIGWRRAYASVKQVELVLQEIGAKYTKYVIDLKNKPAFFTEKVAPRGKVSVITPYTLVPTWLTRYHGQDPGDNIWRS